jgi:hypothetical protein
LAITVPAEVVPPVSEATPVFTFILSKVGLSAIYIVGIKIHTPLYKGKKILFLLKNFDKIKKII